MGKLSKSIAQLITIILLLSINGCSSTLSIEEFKAYINDQKALRVAVQVCLPSKTAFFEELSVDVTDMPESVPREQLGKMFRDAQAQKTYDNPYESQREDREFQTIRKWRPLESSSDFPKKFIAFGQANNVRGVVSYGGKTADLVSSTETNQPVFYSFTHERASDIIALSVRLSTTRNGVSEPVSYWFKLPKGIGANDYTDWIAPVSEERPNVENSKRPFFWLLTHGSEMPVLPPERDAPRIRYTLLSSEQYWNSTKVGRRAINLVKLSRLISPKPETEDLFHLVPVNVATIPPC